MAPEMIRHELYTSKADVFSWGVLLAEVLSQRPPYEGLYMTPVQVCHCSSFSGTPQFTVRFASAAKKGVCRSSRAPPAYAHSNFSRIRFCKQPRAYKRACLFTC